MAEGWGHRYLPPLLAASTASAGSPNWHMRGPSCPEAKAALNMPRACGKSQAPESMRELKGTTGTKTLGARGRATGGSVPYTRLPTGHLGHVSTCWNWGEVSVFWISSAVCGRDSPDGR